MKRRQAWTRSIICLLFLAAISDVTFAGDCECGVLLTSEQRDEPLAAPVVGSFVHLEVTGIVARGRVTQIFTNPTDEWLSGVYLLPLPENAAVDALTMRVGERVLEARVAEREEAQAAYDRARESGVKAALLAQVRPDVFTASVAQVGPGEEIEIEVELQFEVRYDGDRFRLRFPLLVADRYRPATPASAPPEVADPALPSPPTLRDDAANPVALRVDLDGGYRLSTVDSPTHDIRVIERPRFAYSVLLADDLAPADGDFVLEWAPEPSDRPRVTVAVEQRDGAHYALLMVMPPASLLKGRLPDVRVPREAIFVIDTSGSMEGTALEQAKRALVLALDDLAPIDRFNVIGFSDGPERLFETAVPADSAALQEARCWVSALDVNGGTMIVPALEAALAGGQASSDRVRQVVFVTDGQVENESEFFTRLRQLLGASRLFTVGIGSAPGGHFMRRAAELGRGSYTFISDPSEVEQRMTSLLAKLTAPVLTDVEVFWHDPTAEAWPRRIGDLYLGEPLVVAARLLDPEIDVRLTGRLNGQLLELTVPLAGAVAGKGIGKLWARRQVAELLEPPAVGDQLPEADPAEVRRQVVELALSHRLVTRFTSLIAVDDVATGSPGDSPDRLIPLQAPRGRTVAVNGGGGGWGGELVEEMIVVTSEAPMIELTVTSLATSHALDELELIPLMRPTWTLVTRAPGVVAGREPAPGEVDAPRVRAAGAASDQNVIVLDGFEITDDASGEPSFELDGPSLEEVRVASGGDAIGLATPGLRIDLTTPRLTNRWIGSAGTQGSGGGGTRAAAELEIGGPLKLDHLWLWAGASDRDGEREVLVDPCSRCALRARRIDVDSDHAAGKLHTGGYGYGVEASWHRGTTREDGRGAGPDRLPSATWHHRDRSRLLHLRGDAMVAAGVHLSAGYGRLGRRAEDRPLGGLGGDAFTGARGITGGTTFARAGERETTDGRFGGVYYFGLGATHHDLEFGARRRRHDASDRWLAGGSRWLETGDNVDLDSGVDDVLTSWHDTTGETALDVRAGWLQDTLTAGRLTLLVGLRWDQQRGTSRVRAAAELSPEAADAGAGWQTVVPRLGLTLKLDAAGRTVLRAAYGRFASRLGPALSSRLADPPVADVDLFSDADGDLVVDPDEAASRRPWIGIRPDRLAPDLSPELTDHALLGIEHQPTPRFVTGLALTHRRSRHLLERRILIRDAGGAVRQANAGDWVPSGVLRGTVPGAGPYAVAVFDLVPGLELVPSGLWVNGDRRRESLAASLTWRGRLGERWRTQGHLSWSDERMRLGPEFRRFDDPTDALGSGDDDGDRAVELGPRGGAGGGGWTFHGSAGVELPWALDLGFAVNGRQGHPLPYHRRVARARAGIVAVELTGAAGAMRGPDLLTFDVRLAKELTFGDLSLSLAVEAFNLLGSDAVLRRELDLGVGRAGAVDEVTAPRVWRLGVRLGWR